MTHLQKVNTVFWQKKSIIQITDKKEKTAIIDWDIVENSDEPFTTNETKH